MGHLRVWALVGVGSLAVAGDFPALTHVQQVRAPDGRPAVVQRVACLAPDRPELAAALTLEEAGPLRWQVTQLATNEAGAAVLETGRTLPQIAPHYQRYVTQGQPVGRVTFAALLGTWKLFGLKFSWENVTYRCALS
ncbi:MULTISPECIES: hypothetical protein [Deinococcus]|jgi:hypothetical protein|uniref:Uncharacterized protein n=2 Tax=Deinococcus soli (ex Cha et al. 2016) TaxID=1309411 RepID=A0A0F7JR20_9DEIO|nr:MULTISPECIES: hypothetical protein [Deinococcus]AKH17193.1 hypothetical protein SY84_09190 [Deinococcus soli (ex Cha et al. 2016)]MDK2014249.1 hypothetical protein [Deinococcus sp. 43]MDR6221324.1 hypothetical protein [Deinococcus soli (ex Cha et al. 2016)]MDR6331293.1 hypothetical protein [Deinococcus soli (ex Cha et al. 2016)]MDR6754473.1 hypothetical protein [Deinococcus soli (ex Cha et al. 2016)]